MLGGRNKCQEPAVAYLGIVHGARCSQTPQLQRLYDGLKVVAGFCNLAFNARCKGNIRPYSCITARLPLVISPVSAGQDLHPTLLEMRIRPLIWRRSAYDAATISSAKGRLLYRDLAPAFIGKLESVNRLGPFTSWRFWFQLPMLR
jgi:hypothetical protein